MTNFVLLKRAIWGLLLISILVNCDMWNSRFGREEIKLGEYVTLEVETPTEGQSIRWIFSQLPDSSMIQGFLPSDTLTTVSFQPDLLGEYNVTLEITENEEVESSNYYFDVVMNEDNTVVNGEIPQHLFEAYTEDTTVADTPVVELTEEGDPRKYMSKVVSPNQPKATPTRKSASRTKAVKRKVAAKASRGNLIPRAAKTFTIQVSSWPSLDEAQSASQELLDKYGIDSYIQRAFFKDKDEIYYRLRVGNFQESSDAEAYAKEIQDMTSLPVWVDFVRQEM